MGYRDKELELSKSQVLAADANSTDYLDTELTIPGWEKGQPAAVIVTVEAVTVASTGIEFVVCHKTSEPTVNDANLVAVTALAANLTKGSRIVIALPRGIPLLRYVRLYYNLTNGAERYTVSAYFTPLMIG